jgi:hypothetical protein
MSWSLRTEYENVFYHVMNRGRGRGRQQIFPGTAYSQAYSQDYLRCRDEAHRFGIEAHAYCLMGTDGQPLPPTRQDASKSEEQGRSESNLVRLARGLGTRAASLPMNSRGLMTTWDCASR